MNPVNSTSLAAHLNDEDGRILEVRSNVMNDVPGYVLDAVHLSDFSLDDHHVVIYSQGERVIGERMDHV